MSRPVTDSVRVMLDSFAPGRRVLTLIVVLFVLITSVALTSPRASAGDTSEMYFPIVGEVNYSDTFGDCRGAGCSRGHEGVDIMGAKLLPVVAVADGTVGWVKNTVGGNCCSMSIQHDDGWESYYIHMNNDTPGTDDGLGQGIAPGIEPGVRVRAGQLIGWVGDSGNAENSGSHVHFELHKPDGTVVNPTPYVDAAFRLTAPLPAEQEGSFWDDDYSVHRFAIDKIADVGITKGCNPPDNNQFCPERSITRGEMAAFLKRALDLPPAAEDYFDNDSEVIFEGDINAIMEAGIGFGCSETDFCSYQPLRREEMAEFLVRAFGYTNDAGADLFIDDEESPFEDSINKLGVAGVTLGCNPPANDEFCPTRSLSRAEMATFFVRALDL